MIVQANPGNHQSGRLLQRLRPQRDPKKDLAMAEAQAGREKAILLDVGRRLVHLCKYLDNFFADHRGYPGAAG